ncbi:UDP-glycosyltransferase [Melia azedarach]|uniref:UDP-glycosyltransferase n=1 Tax=Melia azedarach TaxID=155640 RepID=A0ACC1YCK5_MELAZ|nr:UDP-glycosyltransferase [Melia azedarach]
MSKAEPQSQPHIAVLAFPYPTHASPLLSLITRLAVAAPNALFSFIGTAQCNTTVFTPTSDQRPPNIIPYNISDGVPVGYVFTGKLHEDIELFLNAADRNFRKAIDAAVIESGRRLSCLVTDAFIWLGKEMAEDRNVPWIAFWTGGPNSLAAHVYTDLIRERIQPGEENRSLEFIPGLSKLTVADFPEGTVLGNLQSVFSVMQRRMRRRLPKAAAVFINCFEELDRDITIDLQSRFKKFFNIGPLNMLSPSLPVSVGDDKYGCLPWLDKQKKAASVAYIGFGSAAKPSPKEMVAIAEALEASKVPFIWSIKENLQENLPNGFLERIKSNGNGMLVDWAPQVKVLGHEAVGVFVTHCGWNSILESVAGGVPMIGRPFWGDQGIDGKMIEDVWGIGVIVEGGIFTKNALMCSFDLILTQERGKKIREKTAKLKQLTHNAVGPRGSSKRNFDSLLQLVVSTSYEA